MTNVHATALRGLAFASYRRGELTIGDLEERLEWIRQQELALPAPAPRQRSARCRQHRAW